MFSSSTRRLLLSRLVPHPSGSISRLDVNSIRAKLQSVPMSASGAPTTTSHCSARPVRSAPSLPMVAHAAAMLRRQGFPLLLCFLSAASADVCAPSSTCDGPRRVVNLRNLFSVCKKKSHRYRAALHRDRADCTNTRGALEMVECLHGIGRCNVKCAVGSHAKDVPPALFN